MNRTCKTSETPLKDQTYKSWAQKEREEVQAKDIQNIFNQIIAENFPNLERQSSRCRSPLENQLGKTRKERVYVILQLVHYVYTQ
jgi:hypothetical protein